MSNYICSRCGKSAYYDGRCGDGPILLCGCDKGPWVDDGRGGYHYPTGAEPIQEQDAPRAPWPHNPNGGRD